MTIVEIVMFHFFATMPVNKCTFLGDFLHLIFRNYSGFTNIRLPKKAEGHRGFAFIEFNTKLAAKVQFIFS